MEYLLVQAQIPSYFTDKVNLAISKGFEPIGGVAMQLVSSLTNAQIIYAQAMIKPDRTEYSGVNFDGQKISILLNALQENK